MTTRCWMRTAPSPRAARWTKSPPVKGAAPKPFIGAGAAPVAKDAVWDTSAGLAADLRAKDEKPAAPKPNTKPRTHRTEDPHRPRHAAQTGSSKTRRPLEGFGVQR